MSNTIISVKDMTVEYNVKQGKKVQKIEAISNVSLDIHRGEMLGIIGESGSGKTTLGFGILNLIDHPGEISTGSVLYMNGNQEVSLLELTGKEEQAYRWNEIASVFQAAQSALNPIITVWDHFYDTYEAHAVNDSALNKEDLRLHVEKLFEYVRLDKKVLNMYSFELSGGMKQRVLIALSLLLDPAVIILDEPTTALDVITQWYILDILRKINKDKGITIVFMTHDISIISSLVDRIVVMYAGQIVEIGPVKDVYERPAHPYTKALLGAIPTLNDDIHDKVAIDGNTYDMLSGGDGCRFFDRCKHAQTVGCPGKKADADTLFDVNETQKARCKHFYTYEKGRVEDEV